MGTAEAGPSRLKSRRWLFTSATRRRARGCQSEGASANVPAAPPPPTVFTHPAKLPLSAVRDPIITWWPRAATSFDAIAVPAIPVPRTAIFIAHLSPRRRRPTVWAAVQDERAWALRSTASETADLPLARP